MRLLLTSLMLLMVVTSIAAADLPFIAISKDQKAFIETPSGSAFTPWGVNYDHDPKGRLIEDYWDDEWATVEEDFREIKDLGFNLVRVHLQFGKFMTKPNEANTKALDRLGQLVRLAESIGLYLDLTGLACYHKADVPAWYDALSESERWDAQAAFWTAVAKRCANSPAIFCYDLMNEPVVPGGQRKDGDWLGPAFAGKHFVQFITLDQKQRPRPEIAKAWVDHLVHAIRKVDTKHLITVGLVHWSLDRKGLTSGFVPDKIAENLDFLCVHLYPETNKIDDALETLKGFSIGKPVMVEETFPLKCSPKELDEFISQAGPLAAGWVSFYWGTTPDELQKTNTIGAAIQRDWLERFSKRAKQSGRQK
jgi:hypothetical protein